MTVVKGCVLIMTITYWRRYIVILFNILVYLESNMMPRNSGVMMFVTDDNFIETKDLRTYYFTRYIMVEKVYGNLIFQKNTLCLYIYIYNLCYNN